MGFAPAPYPAEEDYIVSFSEVDINIDRGVVIRAGSRVVLSRPEFELLKFFLVNAGRDLSRDAILQAVWSGMADPNTRTGDAHVMRLRRKLEPEPDCPRHFVTLHKIGYRFQP